MATSNYFFLIFLGTIVLTRLVLNLKNMRSPMIYGLRLHHYMYGIILVIFSIFKSNPGMYAVGLGLFADEIPQIVPKVSVSWENYHSLKSIAVISVIIVLVYLLQGFILSFI
jgi:hypothetical protein